MANPGCFATCIQLGLLPAAKMGLINSDEKSLIPVKYPEYADNLMSLAFLVRNQKLNRGLVCLNVVYSVQALRDSVLLYWMKMVRQMYLSEKMISVGRSTETMSRLW